MIALAAAALTAIVGATVVDGGGRADVADAVVVIRGGVIAAAGDRMRTGIPKGAVIVDGRRLWLAPAPDAPVKDAPALVKAAAALVRASESRIQPGKPARLVLLDGDPRRSGGAAIAVRRSWPPQ